MAAENSGDEYEDMCVSRDFDGCEYEAEFEDDLECQVYVLETVLRYM